MSTLQEFAAAHPFLTGLGASTLAGAGATTLGALPVLFMRKLGDHSMNLLLAFAAGVMLAATMFSLLQPGFEFGVLRTGNTLTAALGVVIAMGAGGTTLWLAHRHAPHEHFCKGCEGDPSGRLGRIWLFVIAILIHNFPEGLAVGVGAASGDLGTGLGVTLGIGLQNVPEGLAVAGGMLAVGYTRGAAFLVALVSGLVEPIGGLLGAGTVALSSALLPWALGFAAGAMLFVISSEVIPETHRSGYERGATTALFVGFGGMFLLTALLG
jgi:ZIP family zinc transporter